MKTIEIDSLALEQMKIHAERDYPDECCGALFATDGGRGIRVVGIRPIDNVTVENRQRRFSVSPQDYLRVECDADAQGLLLAGFYHSHPDHPARPSQTDRAFAQPGFSYPILSVVKGEVAEITSWRIENLDAEYEQEVLEVIRA